MGLCQTTDESGDEVWAQDDGLERVEQEAAAGKQTEGQPAQTEYANTVTFLTEMPSMNGQALGQSVSFIAPEISVGDGSDYSPSCSFIVTVKSSPARSV